MATIRVAMYALSIKNLTKTYSNGLQALKGIDFDVEPGDFYALLGPNGAGKTTAIGIICSLVNKTSGQIRIFGHDLDTDVAAAKACIGLVPQELNLNIFDSALNIVVNQAGYYGINRAHAKPRAERYLRKLGLWDKRKGPSRELSGGMKRRLMIARALLHEPELLILDEPTAGVDIELRRSMWEFLREINAGGTTIILTTHYLEEAERFCDTIAIIHEGDLVACESTATLIRRLDRKAVTVTIAEDIPTLPAALAQFDAELMSLGRMTIRYRPSETRVGDILTAVAARGLNIVDLTTEEGDLVEIILALTNRPAAH